MFFYELFTEKGMYSVTCHGENVKWKQCYLSSLYTFVILNRLFLYKSISNNKPVCATFSSKSFVMYPFYCQFHNVNNTYNTIICCVLQVKSRTVTEHFTNSYY